MSSGLEKIAQYEDGHSRAPGSDAGWSVKSPDGAQIAVRDSVDHGLFRLPLEILCDEADLEIFSETFRMQLKVKGPAPAGPKFGIAVQVIQHFPATIVNDKEDKK